jgi:hypothetical protein
MNLFKFFGWKSETTESESEYEKEVNQISNTDVVQSANYKNQLEFVDASKLVFASLPIQLAKDVPVNSKKLHDDNDEKFRFPICPGTFDYSRLGYIMPAWSDFHFKVNKAGCAAIVGGNKKQSLFRQPHAMDASIVKGLFKLQDGIQLKPYNLNSPWKVFSYDKDISALLLPAWYHSDPEFLDNFYIYPGIVDYNTFHTMNVILAPKKKCEYTIKAGDPMLHIIPFYNKEIRCGYGPPSIEQESLLTYDPTFHESNFYRKNHSKKKSFKLEPQSQEENKE